MVRSRWLPVTVFILVLLLMALYKCIEQCGTSFDTERKLEIHRSSCRVYLTEDVAFKSLRERLEAKQQKKAQKRRRVEHQELSLEDASSVSAKLSLRNCEDSNDFVDRYCILQKRNIRLFMMNL